MGDCGRVLQIESSCATPALAHDMSDARDIARRFEQLETQWMSFQRKSAKLEGEKDTSQKSATSSPRTHLPKHAVASAASSYSNPLFTSHTAAKPAQTVAERTSSSSRIDRAPFSCLLQRKSGFSASSPRDISKDDNSSSRVSPFSSPRPGNASGKDGQVMSPSSESMYTRATVPTFFREKPPLSPAVQPMPKAAPAIHGNEKHVSCAASTVTRQSWRKKVEYRRDSLKLPEILGLECPPSTKPSSTEDHSRECACETEMVESLQSITYPSSSDPATYSSGKGPPDSNLSSSVHSEQSNVDQSRSPPSVPQISGTEEDLLSCFKGAPERNISWRVLAERGVVTEGSLRMDKHGPTELNLEDVKTLSSDKPVNEAISMNGNLLKLEVQVDKKDVFETERVKQGDRLDKVNWELRLSKREAALRIAEEKLLEEHQNISQARLAVSRCEDALRQREHDVQHESEIQKNDLAETLNSIETGKTVMRKLCTGLKDVLWHLEQKENVIQNTWQELKDSVDTEMVFGDHSFGFEPEVPQKDRRSATFEGISFLIAEGQCEEWCSTVVGICERLVAYMSRETHLQKWGTVLEKEGMRLAKMSQEMAKAKEAASEQCARSEEMMKCAEEQAVCMAEERVKLARDRDNLILWVTHLQERRKAVAECEREAATSLAEVQKKAADLFVHESHIDGRALEISALQEELRVTSQRLQDDQELINREKHKVQEKLKQAAGKEREADSKISLMKKMQGELTAKAEQLEKDRAADEKRREKLLLTLQETEERINAKESSLRELEKELDHKGAAAEEMTNNLNERDKLLTGFQRQMEQERSKIREMMTVLEKEKSRLKEAEEAVAEAHTSKKSAEDAWARTTQERRESSEYLKSVEERLKQWEDRLRCKEKELQGHQKKLQEIENQAREEQEHSEALHAKLVLEQESWTQELKAKQEGLSKRGRILDAKEEEINNDLERLTEERRVALEDIKRLAEMETRAWGAERELQTKHDEHLKEVRKHASEYHSEVEDLELAKREVKKEFEEVRAKKQELKIWQREAEETLQNRIDSFIKGKEELTAQIKELKKLQKDIELAGSQIIDRVAELDQASTRLERQRHKVETSKSKLEGLADKLATHQEVLKRRESGFLTQESKLVAVQNGLKKMAAEAATKEKNLRTREQAVIDSENDLHDVEARLLNERKDLEKMIAEVEQHAAKLKEETASVEEISRSRIQDELTIEERREQLQGKERELVDFETDLKKKAKSLEEHGQTISKLENQVKERLQRAANFETKSEELEKGWEKLALEREALSRAKAELQKSAEPHKVQWQMDSDIDETKRKRTEIMEGLRAREAAAEAHEAKAVEREAALLKMEQQAKAHKDQVEKDAQELRQQLHGARAELEDQRRYAEEKRKAAEAIASVVEEREARLKLREQEFSLRNLATESEKGHHGGETSYAKLHTQRQSIEVGGSPEHEHQAKMLGMRLSDTEGLNDVAQWVRNSEKGDSARLGYQHVTKECRTQLVLDEGMEDRLKQMEESFQKEAAKISHERANLQLQQQDLEETKKAVDEVKLTLTAQLKATKQMVADAALTAQNASREREALEEERKRLARDQRDAEASVAAKEAKLATEAKQLENMKSMLEQERTKAVELMQQAAKRSTSTEHASSASQWLHQQDTQCEASLKDREKELNCTADAIRREKKNLKEERAQVKMLHDALEREQIEHSHKNIALIKDAENRMAWEKRREREAHSWNPTSEGSLNHPAEEEFSFSAMKSGAASAVDLGEGPGSTNIQAYHQVVSNTNWDEAFGSATSSISPTYATPEKPATVNSSSYRQILEKNSVPSRKRLENVMTSLMHARQASRSRLQRTENALLAFPPSSGFITQVQQALNTLSARLSLMEQIEEGLESHLRNVESPDSEGILVDKAQLLCRMEEQQSLRAEWEEDMQRQLETISMLQAASRSSPNFTTPPRIPSHNMYQSDKGHLTYEMMGRVGESSTADLRSGGGSRPSNQFNWNTAFESPHLGVDPKGLSYSPLVDYEYLSSPVNHDHEPENHERNTRRKLLLSPPSMTYT